MRALLPLLALGLIAGCSGPSEVSATPPTVSYHITGNDVAQAGVNAQQYCGRYGRTAQFQGVQATGSGSVAVYACQ